MPQPDPEQSYKAAKEPDYMRFEPRCKLEQDIIPFQISFVSTKLYFW
mgnify:CR=1 FL=1